MKETKIYLFLSSLTAVQLNRLTRYLESPYFNRNEKLLKIYYRLEALVREGAELDVNKKEIWELIYPNENYHDEKFRKHCSELLDLGEAFLAQQVYDENPVHQANYLLQAVHQKQIEKLFNSSQSKAISLAKKQLNKGSSHYYYLYEIEKNLYKLNNLETTRVHKGTISKINLADIVNNLDYFYISEKLKYYCSLLSWNRILALDSKLLFIHEIIEIARKDEFKEIPPIAIYLKIYDTFIDNDNINNYWELKKLIERHLDLFPIDEAKEIIESAINYNIRNLNKSIDFQIELFELYKKSLEKEIIFVNDEISPWTFKNIITLTLRLKEFDWTEQFIKDYSERLNPLYKENSVNYNMALLYYHKKDFNKVIPLLQKVEYEELFYGLNSKAIMISTYFELDEIQVLTSFLESFKNFLSRDKSLNQSRKLSYLNLVKFTKKLIDTNLNNEIKLEKLKNDILNENTVGKPWLLEKVEELRLSFRVSSRKSTR
jgi:hypothetical protein